MAGLVRLGHPFPSAVNAVATGGIATLAGADAPTALRLGAAMFALQVSIGATNDVVDAAADLIGQPSKPIPAGLVGRRTAVAVAAGAAVVGLGLALPSGLAVAGLGLLGLGLGDAYSLWLKRTAWSWLPFAVAIPLVPVFGWLGAAGALPPALAILIPAGALAGAAIALANAGADIESDRVAGVETVATRLGLPRLAAVSAGLWLGVAGLVVAGIALAGGARSPGPAALIGGGAIVVGLGWALSAGGGPARRRLGWEVQAGGLAVLGVGWLGLVAES